MPRLSALLGLVGLALALSGCGPTAPSSVTGTWNGTWLDPGAGPASMTMTLTQSGTALVGTWSLQFVGAPLPITGTLTGALNGTNLTATFSPANPAACERDITATVDQTSMKGTYVVPNCTSTGNGTITLKEQ